MGVKISQVAIEVLATPLTVSAQVTQAVMEVVYANAYTTPGAVTGAAVSSKVMEVVMLLDEDAKVSQQVLEIVFSDTAVTDISQSYPLVID